MWRNVFFFVWVGWIGVLLCGGVVQYLVSGSTDAAKQVISSMGVNSTLSELSNALPTVRQGAEYMGGTSEGKLMYALLLRRIAGLTEDQDKRVNLLCEGLTTLDKAISQNPTNSRLLLNWADLRQLLGTSGCGADPRMFRHAVQYALQKDRSNPSVVYSAALIELFDGNREAALKMFRQYLSLATNVQGSIRHYLINLLRNEEELRALLPPILIMVVEFSESIAIEYPDKYRQLLTALSDIQQQALEASIGSPLAKNGGMSYRDLIIRLGAVAASNEVRMAVDLELASRLESEGKNNIPEYFRLRSNLREVKVVGGYKRGDSKPTKSNLNAWGENTTIAFDDYYQSIGFYVEGSTSSNISLIELEGREGESHIITELIEVYVSSNNESWEVVKEIPKIQVSRVQDKTIVGISVPPLNYPYWKIHFPQGTRPRAFIGESKGMIKAYSGKVG